MSAWAALDQVQVICVAIPRVGRMRVIVKDLHSVRNHRTSTDTYALAARNNHVVTDVGQIVNFDRAQPAITEQDTSANAPPAKRYLSWCS